jgi:RNA polymerase sigma factor (sigma-70 family)
MVLGVCRRALKHPQDAEDACQATFLVFARKAGAIRKTASLGSWLHGIACRISANLKRQQARRQKRERQAALAPARPDGASANWEEAQTILDEELGRLPERYRAPLLLCYWEGKTRDEAAAQLGLSAGKLHGLLERGRALLRERLTQRGLTLSAALGASLLAAGTTRAALAPTLVVASTKAALRLAAGEALSPSLVSGQVTTLTKEVLSSMFFTKLKIATVSVLCVGLVAVLIGGSLGNMVFAQGPAPKAAPGEPRARSESDEAFIRRLSKDLRGSDPTSTEVHFFVTSQEARKRQKLIDLFIQERQANRLRTEQQRLVAEAEQILAAELALDLLGQKVNQKQALDVLAQKVNQKQAQEKLEADLKRYLRVLQGKDGNAPPKSDSDDELIRGTWVVVALRQTNHEPTKAEKEFFKKGGYKITITADKMIHSLDKSEMKYRLDTTRTPRVMEFLEGGKVIAKAIYELKGDDLKFCQGRRPKGGEGPKAPTDFDVRKAQRSEFPTLFILKRDTAKAAEKK